MPYYIPEQFTTSASPGDVIEVAPGVEQNTTSVFGSVPLGSDVSPAEVTSSDPFYIDFIDQYLSLGSENPVEIVLRFINVALSFIGIVFLSMILYTGVLVLFSGGEEERVQKAKKTFFNALIGLGIIFLAYSITQFVITALADATGADQGLSPDTVSLRFE